MSTLQPYYQFNNYPSKIPSRDADVFAASGAARLIDQTIHPDAIMYSFADEGFTMLKPQTNGLQRRRSSSALNTSVSGGMLVRPSTPQPNTQVQQTTQIAPTPRMVLQAAKFEAIVTKYNNENKDAAPLNFGHCKTVSDLQTQLQNLASGYVNASSTKNSALQNIRKWMRKLDTVAPGVNSCLRLLPGDSKELSFLVGGLKIVFDAAARLGEMREDTYLVLEAIPDVLLRANKFSHIYTDLSKLQSVVERLYIVTMDVIGEIVTFYGKSPLKKAISAIIKSDEYGKAMKACQDKLTEVAASVEKEASVGLHMNTQETRTEVDQIKTMAQSQLILSQSILLMMRDSEDYINQNQFAVWQEIRREREEKLWQQQALQQQMQWESDNRKQFVINCVQFNREEVLLDQEFMLRSGRAMNREDQGYAVSMLQTPRLRAWLESITSAALAINSGLKDATVSPVSLASVMLIRMLSNNTGTVTLFWFCSRHIREGDVHKMVASLIGQLCRSSACVINFNDHWNQLLEDLRGYAANTNALICVLGDLIQEQLKHTPVTIIIDSASTYERLAFSNTAPAFFNLMRWLTQLKSYSLKPIKLLLSSPSGMKMQTLQVIGAEILDLNPLRVPNPTLRAGMVNTIFR